jgi:hypothetical protein
MRILLLLLGASALAAVPEFKLVLDDGFDGAELDAKTWTIETGKRRDSLNSPKAVDLQDGASPSSPARRSPSGRSRPPTASPARPPGRRPTASKSTSSRRPA